MRAIAAGLTDIGRERNHNEDRFILLPEFNVFVVADGMGGHQSGEVASRMAAATIASFFRAQPPPGGVGEQLRAAVCDANAKIFARADDSRAHRGMGTTVVAAAYSPSDGFMHVCHAGDSRAYHLRGPKLKQLTIEDEDLVKIVHETSVLTEACARLVEAANRNGGRDNITAVLVRIEGEAEPWSRRSPGARASTPPKSDDGAGSTEG
ncbi:MAG: serine/threonine-protein phosphatase [Polyangiaceae bacterium]|nr:serine/threonine-protein phosphatase [Polyangiaceae bacterium]